MRKILFLTLVAVVLLLSCSKDEPVTPSESGFTISGSVRYDVPLVIPDSAHLVGIWIVSATSPDYEYLFGEGSIDREHGTFSITFSAPPSAEALNGKDPGIGVAAIALITGDVRKGRVSSWEGNEVIGGVDDLGVIFVQGDPAGFKDPSFIWPARFKSGYNAGRGVYNPEGRDAFEPWTRTGAVLIVGTNIRFPEWT